MVNYLDFNSNDSVQSFLDFINKRDRIDVLINNAGVNKIATIDKIDEDEWDWINKVNLRGPFLLTKAVSEIMKKKAMDAS